MNDDPKAVGDRISLGWMIDESPPTDFFLCFSQAEKLIFWKFWVIFLTYVMTFHLINTYMGMDQCQYLLIPFLVGWTSINPSYFDVHQGYKGFDPSPYKYLHMLSPAFWRGPGR